MYLTSQYLFLAVQERGEVNQMNTYLHHAYVVTYFTKQHIYKNISALFQSKI